jgi:hypothetical protein
MDLSKLGLPSRPEDVTKTAALGQTCEVWQGSVKTGGGWFVSSNGTVEIKSFILLV